jgi:hypothetical protein
MLTVRAPHAAFSVARSIFWLALPGDSLREHINHYPVCQRGGRFFTHVTGIA